MKLLYFLMASFKVQAHLVENQTRGEKINFVGQEYRFTLFFLIQLVHSLFWSLIHGCASTYGVILVYLELCRDLELLSATFLKLFQVFLRLNRVD